MSNAAKCEQQGYPASSWPVVSSADSIVIPQDASFPEKVVRHHGGRATQKAPVAITPPLITSKLMERSVALFPRGCVPLMHGALEGSDIHRRRKRQQGNGRPRSQAANLF